MLLSIISISKISSTTDDAFPFPPGDPNPPSNHRSAPNLHGARPGPRKNSASQPPTPTCEVRRQYANTTPEQVAERLRDVDIATALHAPALSRQQNALSSAVSPRLKLVAVIASGTDSVDLTAASPLLDLDT